MIDSDNTSPDIDTYKFWSEEEEGFPVFSCEAFVYEQESFHSDLCLVDNKTLSEEELPSLIERMAYYKVMNEQDSFFPKTFIVFGPIREVKRQIDSCFVPELVLSSDFYQKHLKNMEKRLEEHQKELDEIESVTGLLSFKQRRLMLETLQKEFGVPSQLVPDLSI